MNWLAEGKKAAEWSLKNQMEPYPECPWPIHTPEGYQWMKGWNAVALGSQRPRFHDDEDEDEHSPFIETRPSDIHVTPAFFPTPEEMGA